MLFNKRQMDMGHKNLKWENVLKLMFCVKNTFHNLVKHVNKLDNVKQYRYRKLLLIKQ